MTRDKLIRATKLAAKRNGPYATPDRFILDDPQLLRIYRRKLARIAREEAEIARIAQIVKSKPLPHAIIRREILSKTSTLFSPLAAELCLNLHRHFGLDEAGDLVRKDAA